MSSFIDPALGGHRSLADTFAAGGIVQAQRIGYVRVRTFNQNPERRLDDMPMHKTFTDQTSGKTTLRPQLDAVLSFVHEGDTVLVHSMNRLERNIDDLCRLVQILTK